tara:strand:- start:47 stop:253 length:207 start_codon:yes stop_codon:yes gene_type:complete
MKKSNKKILEKELSKDIDILLSYISKINEIDPENTNVDSIKKDVDLLEKKFKEKYKEYIDKENLDSKK